MTAFDYILLIILFGSMILSFSRGFIKEAISLVSWFIALYVSFNYTGLASGYMTRIISSELTRYIVVFILLFIATRIVLMFVAKLLKLVINTVGLSFLDRLLGAMFGLVKGILVSLVIVLICGMTNLPKEPFWRNAKFSPAAVRAVGYVVSYLPAYVVKYLHY